MNVPEITLNKALLLSATYWHTAAQTW